MVKMVNDTENLVNSVNPVKAAITLNHIYKCTLHAFEIECAANEQ